MNKIANSFCFHYPAAEGDPANPVLKLSRTGLAGLPSAAGWAKISMRSMKYVSLLNA